MTLVAAACAIPGALAGLLLTAVVPVSPDPVGAGLAGAVLGAAAGAWMEARN